MDSEELRSRLLRLMGGKKYRPMNKSELARDLELSSDDRSALRGELKKMENEGLILEGKKSRYEMTNRLGNELVGTIKFLPRGHAWFYPDLSEPRNVETGIDLKQHSRLHIPSRDTGTALEGDRVAVSFHLPKPPNWRRQVKSKNDPMPGEQDADARGKVVRIIERRSGRLVGTYVRNGKHAWVETSDPALNGSIQLAGETTAQPGQLVVVDIEVWAAQNQDPRGRIIEVLGWPGDAGVDILSVIARHGLRTSFPENVLAEARGVPEKLEPAEVKRREDWRNRLVITIDPADAKDHDDAIYVEKIREGWLLAVHIADVSHYVKPKSGLDKEASERGNSTYLVDRVLPMLPVELSNGLCSLKPDVDRLTKCAVMTVAKDGKVVKARFCDAVIHSQAKLSYEQAQDILDGKPAPEGSYSGLEEMVKEAWKMASLLRKRRFANGALDLEMPEIRVKLDDQGRAAAVYQVEHTASHQLIEECMLAANESVAKVLKENRKPTLYRIHEDPDFGKLAEYGETARAHGYEPGDLSNRAHVQKLLDSAKGRPDEHLIKLGLLKSLKRAAYAAEGLGHYGLAKGDYCHFTSPIRRYADLIVHRSLQPLLDNAPKKPDKVASQGELVEFARHISDTERTSADAENETKQIKMMEYLTRCAASKEPVIFEGVITDVRMMGLLVEASDIGARGVVKREDLPRGDWRFEQSQMRYINSKGQQFQLSQKVKLMVARIDMERKFVDFRIAGEPVNASEVPALNLAGRGGARKKEKFRTPDHSPFAKSKKPRGQKTAAKPEKVKRKRRG